MTGGHSRLEEFFRVVGLMWGRRQRSYTGAVRTPNPCTLMQGTQGSLELTNSASPDGSSISIPGGAGCCG